MLQSRKKEIIKRSTRRIKEGKEDEEEEGKYNKRLGQINHIYI